MELIIITGMSGAGKSKAADALEDAGYFCVDNLPPKILLMFTELYLAAGQSNFQKVAVVVDSRSRETFRDFGQTLETLKSSSLPCKILFLDASTDVLLSRYKETRRRHPLMDDELPTLQRAIEAERELLRPLRESADFVIDTSQTIPSQLRERVVAVIGGQQASQPMSITCMSFGFRNGLPPEADLVFDVRCLPNPFYIPELREHSGDEPCVRDYVMQFPQTRQLLGKLEDLLELSVPLYIQEGKSQLVIAVGCTGGRHRSVATAVRLGGFLRDKGYKVAITHRDKEKTVLR